MKSIASIILFILLPLGIIAQQQCMQFPAKKLDIITNPSFEVASGNCVSNYLFVQSGLKVAGWTNLHQGTPTAYVTQCFDSSKWEGVLAYNKNIPTQIVGYRGFYGPPTMTIPPALPKPVPDGSSALLVTDKSREPGLTGGPDQVKSYIATCLLEPLQKDSLYRLDFSVGFGNQTAGTTSSTVQYACIILDNGGTLCHADSTNTLTKANNGISSAPETIAIYGKARCDNFGKYPYYTSCLRDQEWTELGHVTVKGDMSTWVKTSIAFVSPGTFSAFAIGPGCQQMLRTADTAYFFQYYIDNLEMYKPTIERPRVVQTAGSQCYKSATLQLYPAGVYKATDLQWFKNNAPIAGAIGETLHITAAGQGWYQCRVINDSVCLFTDSFGVFWQTPPPTGFLGKGDTTVCYTDSTILNATAGFGATYLWQDGSTKPTFRVTKPGNYSVTVTNACGPTILNKIVNFSACSDSLFIPTAFTPNGDGRNDEFKPVYYYTIGKQYNLTVFNRFGQLLFTSNNIAKGWDGTYKGILQPIDTYIYQVSYRRRNDKTYYAKGTVTLIR